MEKTMIRNLADTVLAIVHRRHVHHGCPYCGCASGDRSAWVKGTWVWNCDACGRGSVILGSIRMGKDAQKKQVLNSRITIGLGYTAFHPRVRKHPFEGKPCHHLKKRFDTEASQVSPGIGLYAVTCGCFDCGIGSDEHAVTYAFVITVKGQTKAASMIGLLGKGAMIHPDDFNESERVRVIVSSCFEHLTQLERLRGSAEISGDINAEGIREAKKDASSVSV